MPALNSGHTIGHITAPHLIWLGHGELPFKVVRDSNMFMTTTFIPVSRLLTADQPQLLGNLTSFQAW
ncbi:hypothetical protein EO241_28665 [Escherichia coli]|nr:hypothetical protein EO241_28665 [Escherichia coli]RZZ14317.1 hypothetical protein EXX21_24590 [Escherichia coli]